VQWAQQCSNAVLLVQEVHAGTDEILQVLGPRCFVDAGKRPDSLSGYCDCHRCCPVTSMVTGIWSHVHACGRPCMPRHCHFYCYMGQIVTEYRMWRRFTCLASHALVAGGAAGAGLCSTGP
jgi:hypothetical protein